MRLLMVLISLLLLAAPDSPAQNRQQQAAAEKCSAVKQKIRRIQSKMRQGYNARQGEKMQQQLRELREQRSKLCR